MKSMILGTIIILFGLSVLLGAVFGIHIPIIKILVAFFFIYLGVKMLFGSFNMDVEFQKRSSDHEAVFSKSQFQYPNSKDAKEYVTVFGSSELDLSTHEDLIGKKMKAVTVFGDSKIYIKKGLPIRIQTETVMGQAALPGKNISALGKFEYVTPGLGVEDPAFDLNVTVVFGNARVIEKE